MSLVFIDIAPFDLTYRGATTVMDFPNRMVIGRHVPGVQGQVQYVYQTLGAIYKNVEGNEDKYITRVFARKRFSGSFFLQDFNISKNSRWDVDKTLKSLLYIEDFDYIEGEIPTLRLSNEKSKTAPSMFPSIIKEVGNDKGPTYSLDGVVLCLNDGQREGLVSGDLQRNSTDKTPSFWLKIQNSMSRLDPIFKYRGQTLYSREMDILEGNQKWLSDEIMSSAVSKFSHVGSDLKIFSGENISIFPIRTFHSITEFLISLANSQSQSNSESQTAKTADSQSQSNSKSQKAKTKIKPKSSDASVLTNIVIETLFPDAYSLSKEMWNYANIFAGRRWYYSILNYPDHSHWMFIAIHSGAKFLYIYDPLYQKSSHDAIELIFEKYIDAEATEFASTPEELSSLKFCNWEKKFSTSQKQPDKINCGVMALIGCFRATVQINGQSSRGKTTEQIKADVGKKWSCNTQPKAMEKYRLMLKDLLTQSTSGLLNQPPPGFVYFSKSLQAIIDNGGGAY